MKQLDLFEQAADVMMESYPEQGPISRSGAEAFEESIGSLIDSATKLSLSPGGKVQRLSPEHIKIVALRTAGLTSEEVAEMIGRSVGTVNRIMNDERSRAMQNKILERIVLDTTYATRERIGSALGEAFETVYNLMRNSEDEKIRQTSAFDILDRGGLKPREVVMRTNLEIDASAGKEIAEALRESAEAAPELDFVEDSVGIFQRRPSNRLRGIEHVPEAEVVD